MVKRTRGPLAPRKVWVVLDVVAGQYNGLAAVYSSDKQARDGLEQFKLKYPAAEVPLVLPVELNKLY